MYTVPHVDATTVTSLSKAPDTERLAKSLAALSSAIAAPQLPTDLLPRAKFARRIARIAVVLFCAGE